VIQNSFVRLSRTLNIGDGWIFVDRDVSNDWFVGDWIAVGATGYFYDESERFQILEISGGTAIRLSSLARYLHYGELQNYQSGWRNFTLDERAEVALLTRNIRMYSNYQGANGTRGPQIMGTSGSVLNLQFIEIDRGGHENVLRRYPIHFHILGWTPGQVVRGCSIHRSGMHDDSFNEQCFD
jgi:hypothetical protein